MRYLPDGRQMKKMDSFAITGLGIPSLVLMEHAAMAVVSELFPLLGEGSHVLIVCGLGNNGADGLAVARLLKCRGICADIALPTDAARASDEWHTQKSICERLGIRQVPLPMDVLQIDEKYTHIVDAIFGTGLSRDIDGMFAHTIKAINLSPAFVVSIDIPSGVNSATGAIMGCAIQADVTVALHATKLGMALYPGRCCCGQIKTADIGIPDAAYDIAGSCAYTMGAEDLGGLPERPPYSNKGTFGRLLVVAGSVNMAGAAFLAAKAAYRAGAGLVRIFTPEKNRQIMQTLVPEAVLVTYDPEKFPIQELEAALAQSTAVIVGSGMGQGSVTGSFVHYLLQYSKLPMVFDADALNMMASDMATASCIGENVILTPHIGEMSRLTGMTADALKADAISNSRAFSQKWGCNIVMKDATTVVAAPSHETFVNTLGNSGMSTGGSGDVLAGIIGGLLATGLAPYDAACYGVLMHAVAGDRAAASLSERAVMAQDILNNIR